MVDVAGQTRSKSVAQTIRQAKYSGGTSKSPDVGTTISYYVDPISGRKTYRVGGESPRGRYTQVTQAEYQSTSVGKVPTQVVERYKSSVGPVQPQEQFTVEGAMGSQYAQTQSSLREAQKQPLQEITSQRLSVIRETALKQELSRSPSSYVLSEYKKTPIQETQAYSPATQSVFKGTQIPKSTFDSEYILKKTFPSPKKETIQPSNQTSKFTPEAMISAMSRSEVVPKAPKR